MSEQQRAESSVHAPLPASGMVLASAEMEHPIAGRMQPLAPPRRSSLPNLESAPTWAAKCPEGKEGVGAERLHPLAGVFKRTCPQSRSRAQYRRWGTQRDSAVGDENEATG